jgi:hypothetical protein
MRRRGGMRTLKSIFGLTSTTTRGASTSISIEGEEAMIYF